MRSRLAACLAILAFALPATASAADAPRRGSGERASVRTGEVQIYPAPAERRIIVEKRSDERLVVIDRDGAVLRKSYPVSDYPRRVERRAYVRDGQRRPFALYGGFFGFDRWGYSREGW